jgi:hypothetical protein
MLIATASLFIACDETKNESDIVDAFFSDIQDETVNPKSYGVVECTGVYLQDFDNAGNCDWQTGTGMNDGMFLVQSGEYSITATSKGATGAWLDLPADVRDGDFQIETYVNHISFGSSGEQAILFGVTDNGNSMCFFECEYMTGKTTLMIGRDRTNWYEKQRDVDLSAWHLYTIRKLNGKLYFFLDKSFIYSCDGFNFQNYGFYAGKGSVMYVDYVRVDHVKLKTDTGM